MRFAWCALALCFAVASGGEPQSNRHRRSGGTGLFLSIVGERPSDKSNVNTPVLPVQLPIQLGGHGGVTLPVLVLPVPVYTQAPDTCSTNHNEGEAHGQAASVNPLSRRPPPPVNPPSYVPTRQQFSIAGAETPDTQPISNTVQFNQQLVNQPDNSDNQQRPVQDIFSSLDISQSTETPVDYSEHVQNPASDPSSAAIATPSRSQFNFNPVKNLPSLPIPSKANFNIGAGGSKVHFGVAGHTPEVSDTSQADVENSASRTHVKDIPSLQNPLKTNFNIGAGGSKVHFGSGYTPELSGTPQTNVENSASRTDVKNIPFLQNPSKTTFNLGAGGSKVHFGVSGHTPELSGTPQTNVGNSASRTDVKIIPSLQTPSRTNFNLGAGGSKVHFGVSDFTPQTSNSPQANVESTGSVQNVPSLQIPSKTNFDFGVGGSDVHFGVGSPYVHSPTSSPQADIEISSSVYEERIPYSHGLFDQLFETSAEVVQSFLRQAPVAPELPAAVPRPLPDRLPVPAPGSSVDAPHIAAAAPPRPRFARSLSLRTDLNVPHADYTEAFNTEWHAESQTARTVVEDGGTTIYRAPLSDGHVQFLEIRKERSGDNEVRRCTLSPLIPGSAADETFPGLPDMEQFEFAGYTSAEGRSLVERWQRVVATGAGEGGAAQGESLTAHHEMLLTRDNGEAVPLKYTVVTDSSVLGPACDGYTHRYQVQRGPSAAVRPDTANECDVVEGLPEPHHEDQDTLAENVARFHPLREFALPTRDTRYDAVLKKYKFDFQRNYIDLSEEAVRKNLLTQHSRFVAAGNRLASTFELAVNFLADRLDDELEKLLGVVQPADGAGEDGLIPFPYTSKDVEDISGTLPDEFDWRTLGAVSPVRFQGTTCSSCWAFAVAGATEGALFKKTNRLVPLSPQCLVDCGRPYGTNGCNGTWPSFAYDYVQARGLPSWDEYTDYQAKVLECKDRSVPPVTHISGHVNVTANSVDALKVAIRKHSPNVVIVDAKAKSFILYSKGVLKDKRCGMNRPVLNHAVIAVGWGKRDGDHFILKNSWTAKWGEGGYIRVDPDSCALLQRPSYPLLTKPNIDREELRAAADNVKED